MSVFSSRKSTTPSSILKKTNLRSRLTQLNASNNTPAKVRFALPHAKKVQTILRDYLDDRMALKDYEQLVCAIRDSELLEDDIVALLKEATRCISLLNESLRLFVEALLTIAWTDRSDRVASKYRSFIVNLVSAHNYHAKFVVERLVGQLVVPADETEWPDGQPSEVDCRRCTNVHRLIEAILRVVPMCKDLLLQSLINHFPYMKKSAHIHEYYLYNLLWILGYEPQMRSDILHLIFSKLVILDVNAPKDRIMLAKEEEMDVDDMFSIDDAKRNPTTSSTVLEIAHTLDVCIDRMFHYFISGCYDFDESGASQLNWDNTKNLYHELLTIFDDIIIKTFNLHHVQFIMFLVCSFKPSISEAFLNHLWRKVGNPNVASIIRETAVNYIASLIARATFIPLEMLKGTLQQMAEWIHSYINLQDGLDCVNSDVKMHSVFYSVCQALFYIVAFRHKDLVRSKKNINFLESLNMAKMVTSPLNPLRVCQPAVIQNFAAVTRQYQLAYCYSIIEHNSRNTLPVIYHDEKGAEIITSNVVLNACFPFDPFILTSSADQIHRCYRNYNESDKSSNIVDCAVDRRGGESGDVDDFLEQSQKKFSYGSSPGFKFKM